MTLSLAPSSLAGFTGSPSKLYGKTCTKSIKNAHFYVAKNNVDRFSDSIGFEDVVENVAVSQIHDIIIDTFIICRFYWVTLFLPLREGHE